MINTFNTIKSYLGSSNSLSARELAAQIAGALTNATAEYLPIMSDLAGLSALFRTKDGEESFDDIQDLFNTLANSAKSLFIENGFNATSIKAQIVNGVKKLFIGDQEAVSLDEINSKAIISEGFNALNINAIDNNGQAIIDNLHEMIDESAAGKSINSALATFASWLGQADPDKDGIASDIITRAQDVFTNFPSTREYFAKAAEGGLEGTVSALAAYIHDTKQLADGYQEGDPNPFTQDTHLTLSEFAPGFLLTTVIGVAQTAMTIIGSLLGPIGTLVSGIVNAVALGVTGVINFLAQYGGHIDFKITTSGSGFFYPVLKRGNYTPTSQEMEVFNTFETATLTLHGKTRPIVRLIYLSEGKVYYEDHLSTDFDITKDASFKTLTELSLTDPSGDHELIYLSNGLGICGHTIPYNNELGIYIPLCRNIHSLELDDACYDPITFSLSERVMSLLPLGFQDCMWIRFATAIFLYAFECMGLRASFNRASTHLTDDEWFTLAFGSDIANKLRDSDASNTTDDVELNAIKLCHYALKVIYTYYFENTSAPSASTKKAIPSIDRNATDALIRAFVAAFDNLHIDEINEEVSAAADGEADASPIINGYLYGSDLFWWINGLPGTLDVTYDVLSQLDYQYMENAYQEYLTYGTDYAYHPVTTADYRWIYTFNLETKPGADIPNLTWSGLINGLIVDALVGAALVCVAVGAIWSFNKIKTVRSKAQAKTEAYWYAYQDAVKAGASKSELNAIYKKYNWSRIKHNILAKFTGGSTLSKSLYNDGSDDSGSVINTVVDRTVEEEEVLDSINDIKILITGE